MSAEPPPLLASSPGLSEEKFGAAYELKFQVPLEQALAVEAWARRKLRVDPLGDHGCYRTTSVYCDSANFDVFHRMPEYRRHKYRLRCYGQSDKLYLERKTRFGDRVRKFRTSIAAAEAHRLATPADPASAWEGAWFADALRLLKLRPVCRVSYQRTAFGGHDAWGPVRLTIDREMYGEPTSAWHTKGSPLLRPLMTKSALFELKFHSALPPLFRELLSEMPASPARVSKYRRCVGVWNLAAAAMSLPVAKEI
jgi:hypothetical protein